MRAALMLCAAVLAFAQQPPDPDRVLARAQASLAEAAAAVPKYTCTETVDRSYFRQVRQTPRTCDAIVANQRNGRSRLSLTATDRLRFDVEVTDGGHEIYAWPGAALIEADKVEDMAGGGPLGTGPFGPFLLDIFSNPAVQFQYLSQSTVAGVSLFEHRYRVPLVGSHYQVQAGVIWRITGYDGTFRLDPESAELKRLTVRTLELPADTASCEATTSMDFDRLRIGEGKYLIPRQTQLQVIGRDAGFTENATVYTGCREFRGESVGALSMKPLRCRIAVSDRPPPYAAPSYRRGCGSWSFSIRRSIPAAQPLAIRYRPKRGKAVVDLSHQARAQCRPVLRSAAASPTWSITSKARNTSW